MTIWGIWFFYLRFSFVSELFVFRDIFVIVFFVLVFVIDIVDFEFYRSNTKIIFVNFGVYLGFCIFVI